MTVADVWEAAHALPMPRAIDMDALTKLYRGASGECPIVKSPLAPPCASGRFGCWTCTVVRKDKSAISLIGAGYLQLAPYLNFRDWLVQIRNDPLRRWPQRRKGTAGLGPFTLAARREILRSLRRLEAQAGAEIVSTDELREIKRLWRLDTNHPMELQYANKKGRAVKPGL